MQPILSAIFAAISFRFRRRASLELEIIALRHQLNVYRQRQKKRIFLHRMDRFFWMALYRISPRVIKTLVIIQPKTLINWHYRGFRMFWRWRIRRGQPWHRLAAEKRDMIYQMKRDNPTWGVVRISQEMGRIGLKVSQSCVHEYLRKVGYYSGPPPSPGWKVFIRNHMKVTAALDFFVVVTVSYKLLYGIVLLSHSRRRILHISATDHPTQQWVSAQVKLAFLTYPKPKYLLRDRDAIYGKEYRSTLEELGIIDHPTRPYSPWHNSFVERAIGSIRRDCLDHVIVFDTKHLKSLLSQYAKYYNYSRTHFALEGDCPVHRAIERPIKGKRIVAIPHLGGLHHRYERRAA